ncbi:N-acetylmuramoyl-L-alanine amidase [Longispora sp. NPDC051575]|uniref:N-acetylmuramoyl-L-alanine amidase n=1 Tax=Longispora sp. NPDC051575 TaxID=3154943 RepID=UPI0034121357
MRSFRRGATGPAVVEIRATLHKLGVLDTPDGEEFDAATELAVRTFQQSRGLSADGAVGDETWRALVAARWQLGDRLLYQTLPDPLVGDDVRQLQERLLEMGYDPSRPDGIFGPATARALAQFQREVGLVPDGSFGPSTMAALRRLGRKVVGGRPQFLRESANLFHSGPVLAGKRIIIDPGHGGADPGVAGGGYTESELMFDLASRLEGRLAAAGVAVHLTRGPDNGFSDAERAALANDLGGDLLISLHSDGHHNPLAGGVATYHYGGDNAVTSTAGERFAGLVQREIVVRTGMIDCRVHAKTWELLRRSRMPAVRVEVGYLTSPTDRARLADPAFRDTVVDALLAAVQRMFFSVETDVPTGTFDVSSLRAMLAGR